MRIAVLTPLDRETRFKDITPAVPDHFIRLRTSARIIKNWAIQFVRIENRESHGKFNWLVINILKKLSEKKKNPKVHYDTNNNSFVRIKEKKKKLK